MAIDWSKAPEGATHATLTTAEGPGNYYRITDKGADLWYPRSGWIGSMNDLNWLIQNAVKRPQAWTGAGLPPVGTVCDVTPHNSVWGFCTLETRECTVLAYHSDFVWIDLGTAGVPVATRIDKIDFTPTRTPEQIAADQRAEAIDKMWAIYWQPHASSAKQALGLLWDAGLRFADEK